MANAISLFSEANTGVSFVVTAKNGTETHYTPEAAIVKGGKQIKAQMMAGAEGSAVEKALNGRYRAATEIVGVAFPSFYKSAVKFLGNPSANKSSFLVFAEKALHEEPGKSGKYNEKQALARRMIGLILKEMAPTDQPGEVIAEQ